MTSMTSSFLNWNKQAQSIKAAKEEFGKVKKCVEDAML